MATTVPVLNAARLGRDGTLAALRQILADNFSLQNPPERIGEDDALFGEGVGLDSLQGLTLLMLIERQFGLTINELDWSVHEIGSLSRLADCIGRLSDEQCVSRESVRARLARAHGPGDLPQGVVSTLRFLRRSSNAISSATTSPRDGLDPFAGYGRP
jgi:acyl carrier protein